MNILAFETSCDETSVAVVKDGVNVLSCAIATSMNMHAQSGGIIPENAARKQIEYILPTIEKALSDAFPAIPLENRDALFQEIDAIAVTVGPGLIGSLLVGVETAKTLATLFNKPIIPVNHVVAHIYAAFLETEVPLFPFLALIVSGGHTDFVYAEKHGEYKLLGGTRDDAAGEAFDKCARIIGLGYPGGPAIAKAADTFMAEQPTNKMNLLPRPMMYQDTIEVSFSGLKTAVMRCTTQNDQSHQYSKEQLAAEVQNAIVDTLVEKLIKAADKRPVKSIIVCGGVSANLYLRKRLSALHLFESTKIKLHVPEIRYCTDNAAMIGSCAYFNKNFTEIASVSPNPELHF